jgi:hypothetical protein
MEHLDGTLSSFERSKTWRSIAFPKVSGYADVFSAVGQFEF